eukprot:gene4338-35519_t
MERVIKRASLLKARAVLNRTQGEAPLAAPHASCDGTNGTRDTARIPALIKQHKILHVATFNRLDAHPPTTAATATTTALVTALEPEREPELAEATLSYIRSSQQAEIVPDNTEGGATSDCGDGKGTTLHSSSGGCGVGDPAQGQQSRLRPQLQPQPLYAKTLQMLKKLATNVIAHPPYAYALFLLTDNGWQDGIKVGSLVLPEHNAANAAAALLAAVESCTTMAV